MERRTIGDLSVSVLGLGTSRLASLGAGRSKSDARTLLAVARDCGINVIDTADTYGSTAAERWVGELTGADATSWVVVTKTGLPTVDLPGPFRVLNQPAKKLLQSRGAGFALDAPRVRRNVERSLRRLRRDRIEVYLLHLPPVGIVNDDELGDMLRELRRSGLVAEFGVSSDDLPTILAARSRWGCRATETAVRPGGTADVAAGALADFDVIANHVMAPVGQLATTPTGSVSAELSPRARLLRHAAATPGVKVVLTGTSSPDHLRQNAQALARPVTAVDLIG